MVCSKCRGSHSIKGSTFFFLTNSTLRFLVITLSELKDKIGKVLFSYGDLVTDTVELIGVSKLEYYKIE